jgi:hypothetical protein
MVEYSGESGSPGEEERLSQTHESMKNSWQRTVADMRAMAEDRREEGYETHAIPAGDTAPVAPGQGPRDYWGLSYLVPGNETETLETFLDIGAFEETGVYQVVDSGSVFMVTECIDHELELVLYVAGSFWMKDAPELVKAATDRGTMYSQFREIDGTHLGGIEHDDPAAFFPNPDTYLAFGNERGPGR